MVQRWAMVVTLVFLVLGASAPANGATSLSGTITALNADTFSPSLTVTDDSGKTFQVSANSATPVTTSQGQKGRLSDLKIGQKVQVSGRYMTYAGSFAAKSITVTQEPTAPTPPAAAPAAPVSSANTKSPSLPKVLKSIPDAEKPAQGDKPK